MMSTPRSFCASIMSCPRVHSEVAEPCQVSPPSSTRLDSVLLEQGFADQVRGPVHALPDAEIDARLAEMSRQQLRVAVGEVQQRYVSKNREVVERLFVLLWARSERKPGRGRGGERLQEFATRQRHWLTGESGSSSSATRCVICSSVSTPLCPKRGMLEQAAKASAL